jgi:hypothetical protein
MSAQASTTPCHFSPCTKPNCPFDHNSPPAKKGFGPCKFGVNCTRDGCHFNHPPRDVALSASSTLKSAKGNEVPQKHAKKPFVPRKKVGPPPTVFGVAEAMRALQLPQADVLAISEGLLKKKSASKERIRLDEKSHACVVATMRGAAFLNMDMSYADTCAFLTELGVELSLAAPEVDDSDGCSSEASADPSQ